MKTKAFRWPLIAIGAFTALVAGLGAAAADGEVGLVVQEGGQATTYCIAYTGDGITGEELLARAGLTVGQFGGSSRTVCSIGGTGCSDASSFSSCFCECQGGDCVYWAFFTREYGKNWVYSSMAFNLLKADDGDLHGWKWGAGGPSSAPAPVDITFEQVCGHAPRGGAVGAAATATPAPAQAAAPTPDGLQQASTGAASPSAPAPSPAATKPAEATSTAPSGTASPVPPDATVTVVVTFGQTPTPATAEDTAGDEPGDAMTRETAIALIAFAVIAALMAIAIAGAAIRGRRDGD